MSHAATALASAALTAYVLTPPTGDGGFQSGMVVLCLAALVAACIMEKRP